MWNATEALIMSNGEPQLELMLLGAILADPKQMQRVNGFANKEMQEVLEGMQRKDVTKLRSWLQQRGVNFSSGKALDAVLMAQNGNRIKAKVKRIGELLRLASPLSETFARLMQEWQVMKAEHEAHTLEAKNSTESRKPPAKLQQPQSGKDSQDSNGAAPQKKEGSTQPKPVGNQQVPGGKQ